MKLLLTEDNVVFDFDEHIVYTKVEAGKGLVECPKDEATHILNKTANSAVMANQGFILIDIDTIPEEVKPYQYKYENNQFTINESYVPYISPEDRIAALEDMVNMLLLNS